MSGPQSDTDPRADRRGDWLILAILVVLLVLFAGFVFNGNSSKRRVTPDQLQSRFEQFGDGPIVAGDYSQGDFARAGYVRAQVGQFKQPTQCKSYVPAFTSGCLQWLKDAASQTTTASGRR